MTTSPSIKPFVIQGRTKSGTTVDLDSHSTRTLAEDDLNRYVFDTDAQYVAFRIHEAAS